MNGVVYPVNTWVVASTHEGAKLSMSAMAASCSTCGRRVVFLCPLDMTSCCRRGKSEKERLRSSRDCGRRVSLLVPSRASGSFLHLGKDEPARVNLTSLADVP